MTIQQCRDKMSKLINEYGANCPVSWVITVLDLQPFIDELMKNHTGRFYNR